MAAQKLEIKLKTLTPLWTGGVEAGQMDRLHETGIIGSLRWWYEAIVRGLGGYVSDPTAENPTARSEFDTKAFEQAKSNGKNVNEALREGIKALCPVSYLFGATGWARLFQLRTSETTTTPLHFRTTASMNQSWLKRVFGGESQNINNIKVPYGDLHFQVVFRNYDVDYAQSQFMLALRFAAEYGGLGARLQHGFGQVTLAGPASIPGVDIQEGMVKLNEKLDSGDLLASGSDTSTPFDLRNFVSLTYDIPERLLSPFTADKTHLGNPQKRTEVNYLPCAFDLRYKGSDKWGMRRWLENPKGPKQWHHKEVNLLMGVSKKKGERDDEDERQASRLCFSMPYRLDDGNYRLQIFGFAPPELLTPEELKDLCNEYIQYVLKVEPIKSMLGKDLITKVQGGQ